MLYLESIWMHHIAFSSSFHLDIVCLFILRWKQHICTFSTSNHSIMPQHFSQYCRGHQPWHQLSSRFNNKYCMSNCVPCLFRWASSLNTEVILDGCHKYMLSKCIMYTQWKHSGQITLQIKSVWPESRIEYLWQFSVYLTPFTPNLNRITIGLTCV